MPLLKNRRRSEALKRTMARMKLLGLIRRPSSSLVRLKGTGYRHPPRRWPSSTFIHRGHKLVVPADSPDKKFILVVGDCHLRAFVEGHIQMPEGELSFGFLSIIKASAADLRTHLLNAVLPQTPEAVCLLAPSIYLSNTMQIKNLGVEFGKLLISISSCWPKVFVLDFPPSLRIKVSHQELIRQEFRQAAAHMGISYLPIAEHFPLDRLELWSWDGMHLSDSDGMPILAKLLWDVACIQVESPGPEKDMVLKDCSVVIKPVRLSHKLQDYLGPRRSARLHCQSLVASEKRAIQEQVEATAPVASPISAPASVSAVPVKEEIATPASPQPLEHTLEKCPSDLWRWNLDEQQPISDEEELEAGPVYDTDASAVGDHMVFNFAIDNMEWQVKIEEEMEDKLRVTPTMQEEFFSRDRQQLPDEVENFREKLSVIEGENIGLMADLQTMKDQLAQRDQEIFLLQKKLSRASSKQLRFSSQFKTMEEKWQKEISQLKELLSKKDKQISRINRKRQARSKANLDTLIQLADVKSALEQSKLTCKSLRAGRAKAQEWHKKKAELEEMMRFKEKIWKDKEANLKQTIEHLTKQNNQLQKLANEKKEQWSL